MLLGLGGPLEASLPALDLLSPRRAQAAFDAVKSRTARLVASLPSQWEYLTHVRATAGAGQRPVLQPYGPATMEPSAIAG
jgi:hypothetical protein